MNVRHSRMVNRILAKLRVVLFFCLGGLFLLCGIPALRAQPAPQPLSLLTIDASRPVAAPETGYLEMGSEAAGKSPQGRTLAANSRYLVLDGKPWLPVMGEFHFTRYPEKYWEEEILKMKAGGIEIVSTYVFWIHHEEVEGQFDWSGRRDLRRFVELCGKHGMYVYPRIGPWGHGEVRNGGFPDWLLTKGPTRVNDPAYMAYVERYYGEIGKQLRGLLWKDGGPVIGVQLENEYSNRAANGGANYILKLKKLAIEAGLDVPLYTVTGWDNAVYPPREVIPVFGGYPDDFWSGSLQDAPPDPEGTYQFHVQPAPSGAGILQGAPGKADEVQLWHYPRFTAELGGGMEVAYHRRPVIHAEDIAPTALTELGSGVDLLGYYMYQGGTNPEGKLSTLQESQETNYPNDLPVKSYDFQAPLREFGQMNGSFRKLKVLHQFLADFGSVLAPMTAVLPDIVPAGAQDESTPRLVARTQGDRGFVFFNNYVRNYPLPKHKGVQVVLKLASETITLPRQPFDIAPQSYFLWPVNLELDGALLKYSTAQPFARLDDGETACYFFLPSPGVSPEFAFDMARTKAVHPTTGAALREGDVTYVSGVAASLSAPIEVEARSGKQVRIFLLTQEQAENSWKVSIAGREHLLITRAEVFWDGEEIHLRSGAPDFSFSIFPQIADGFVANPAFRKMNDEGAFAKYSASVAQRNIGVNVEKMSDPAPSSPVKLGKKFDWRPNAVAMAPSDADFGKAAVWRITLPEDAMQGLSDIFLDIHYAGAVARLYEGGRLLDDNFFNGTSWEIGIKRFAPEVLKDGMELKVLPLRKDAPIYMPKTTWPDFEGKSETSELRSVTAQPEYEIKMAWHEAPR